LDILILAQDRMKANAVAAELRRPGWQISAAPDPSEGVAAARRHRPSVILLDDLLTGGGASGVCEQLRALPQTVDIPIVILGSGACVASACLGFRVLGNATLRHGFAKTDMFAAIQEAQAWRARLLEQQIRAEVVMELASDHHHLMDAGTYLETLCAATHLCHQQAKRLCHAFLEVGQNAIEWGHARFPEKTVRVEFRVHEDRVELIVQDQGPGYDPRNLPHAACIEDPLRHLAVRERLGLRDGGFGLLIARGLVDRLKIGGRGNKVTLLMRVSREGTGLVSSPSHSVRLASP